MNPFLVFGLINLIMSIIIYPMLGKKVTKPLCPDNIKGVERNKKCIKVYFTTSLIVTLIGVVLLFI